MNNQTIEICITNQDYHIDNVVDADNGYDHLVECIIAGESVDLEIKDNDLSDWVEDNISDLIDHTTDEFRNYRDNPEQWIYYNLTDLAGKYLNDKKAYTIKQIGIKK